MLQSEFHNLTGIEVSAKEYAAIEIVYLASDVNKAEFCRLWSQMNKARIQDYKRAKLAEKLDAENRWFCAEIFWYLRSLDSATMFEPLANFVNKRQLNRLISLGFNVAGPRYTIAYDLGKYAGIIED